MPDALLPHFKIRRRSSKECIDFPLLEKSNLISPWHGDPVDIFLWIQAYICHEHRDENFRVDHTVDDLLTFKVKRGTNVLARDKFYAAVVSGGQDRKRSS